LKKFIGNENNTGKRDKSIMIIKCANPNCTSPTQSFDWDETPLVKKGIEIVVKETDSTETYVTECPYCRTPNKIFLRNLEKECQIYGLSDGRSIDG
jgi:hypothetical protein